MKRVLVLLKRSAYDLYVGRHQDPAFTTLAGSSDKSKVVENLLDRHRVHESTVQKCKYVLSKMSISWDSLLRDELDRPIHNVDLVITVGGDGTLLQASHYLGESIPMLAINSDPTRSEEVDHQLEEFDATRSRGYFCAATKDNFEQVLSDVVTGKLEAKTFHRISTTIDDTPFSTPALNDVLLAHPNPAAVSRCTFSIVKQRSNTSGSLIHSRSSGLRVCTAAGSTAATLSAGGIAMPLESKELQYMLREPILPHPKHKSLMHGFVGAEEIMRVTWGCRQGCVYFDGAHVSLPIKFGTVITMSANGPPIKIFLI